MKIRKEIFLEPIKRMKNNLETFNKQKIEDFTMSSSKKRMKLKIYLVNLKEVGNKIKLNLITLSEKK
jgi:hypothetical protein